MPACKALPASWQTWSMCSTMASSFKPLDCGVVWPRIQPGGSGAFKDEALLAGVAVNRAGQPQGSMGIDIGDVDRDGDDDLFVTNLDNEGNTLYLNVGSGLFEDRTAEFGLFKLGLTGFGTRFMDYDNDGWLDLVVVNGAVRHVGSQLQNGDPYPLKQRSQLFRNDRGRKFVDVSDSAGPPFAQLQVARGAATGDLDNDGDIDLVVFNNSGPVRVLQNEVGSRGHWLGVRAIDTRYKRDAVQARVSLAGQRSAAKIVQTDGSYCVASDPRVLFGLGSGSAAQTVRVQWAGGQVEEFRNLAIDRQQLAARRGRARAGRRSQGSEHPLSRHRNRLVGQLGQGRTVDAPQGQSADDADLRDQAASPRQRPSDTNACPRARTRSWPATV